ncbi:MAG: ABC transporter ATP-binding protein, partial [Bacteroidia bacterium]|nr:ABC transporter ATP-binding protein [Bacteroidia bacterium]
KIIAERNKGKLILITSHLLSELDDLISQIIFMQEGQVKFHKTIEDLRLATQEEKISKAIANVLKNQNHEQDR